MVYLHIMIHQGHVGLSLGILAGCTLLCVRQSSFVEKVPGFLNIFLLLRHYSNTTSRGDHRSQDENCQCYPFLTHAHHVSPPFVL